MSNMVEYERLKAEWIKRNPSSTPREYERAIKQIARRAGI